MNLTHIDHDAIAALLVGHRVARVDAEHLMLDNGMVLTLAGNNGGCTCGAGDYMLTELNEVDNIITRVEFNDDPGDSFNKGVYQIFVFADNERINLATFEGSDGNGWYGTGYTISVQRPSVT